MAHRTIIGGLFCVFCEVNISIYFCDGNLFPSQIENNMIDTNQLSALVSAFRVETEKESISPETVGKLLQDILDLLATASTDAERQPRRSRPCQKAQTPPLVLAQILRFGHANQGVL